MFDRCWSAAPVLGQRCAWIFRAQGSQRAHRAVLADAMGVAVLSAVETDAMHVWEEQIDRLRELV